MLLHRRQPGEERHRGGRFRPRSLVSLTTGDPLTLTVHNPGEVPTEVAARFFEKYVSGRKSSGTGLGTYSALLMAKAQLGDLRMHTGAAGTVLTLTLPALKEALPPPRSAVPREEAQSWLQQLPLRELCWSTTTSSAGW